MVTHYRALNFLCDEVYLHAGVPRNTFTYLYDLYVRGKLLPSPPPTDADLLHILYPSLKVTKIALKMKGKVMFRIASDVLFYTKKKYVAPFMITALKVKGASFFVTSDRAKEMLKMKRLVGEPCMVYPGFLPERLRCSLRKKEPCVAVVHAFSVEKRIERVLFVAKRLKEIDKAVKFVVVGDVQDEGYYRYLLSLRKELRVEELVEFVTDGSEGSISEVLERCKCSLWVSQGGYGIVNVESLYCGTRPIVTPLCKSAVGPYGLIYNSLEELPGLILKCLEMENEQEEMRRYALETHSPEGLARAINACLKRFT